MVATCAIAPLHAQETGSGPVRAPGTPLVIARGWLPVASVTMAFPATGGTQREDLEVQAGDGALLAAMREAAAGLPVGFAYDRDATGRYFMANVAPEAVEAVLATMQRAARMRLPARLAEAAVSALRGDLAFRGDLPRSRFDRVLAAHLRGETEALDDTAVVTTDFERLAAEITETTPAALWGPPVWVVVDDEETFPTAGPPERRLPVAAGSRPIPSPSIRVQVPSDAVTRWVGSVFRYPPETTLLEARFVRLVLEEALESRRDPDLFEFQTEIDADGRLVVRVSTSAHASARWEARLDEAVRHLGSEEDGVPLDQLLPPTRSRWSRELAPASGSGRAAAEALLRGATDPQALTFANSAASPPSEERLRAVARGMALTIRVAYGSG